MVVDACATWDGRSEQASWLRMSRHGVVLTNWIAVAAELQADWERSSATVADYVEILAGHNAAFGGLLQAASAA